jgi:RND family efflux transporter MFP subunit
MDKRDAVEDLRSEWPPGPPEASAAGVRDESGGGLAPSPVRQRRHREPGPYGHRGPDGHGNHPAVVPSSEHAETLAADLPQIATAKVLVGAGAFIGLLVGLFLVGYVPYRERHAQALKDAAAAASAEPVVNVVKPKAEDSATDLVLPGDVQALQYTSIFPRTNGYLKRLLVDIGDHVEANQLLAVIDTPEVDAQLDEDRANLEQAKVNLVKAQTDLNLAQVTLNRYESITDKRAVSQQDLDNARAQYESSKASVDVAKAAISSAQYEVQRLEVLQGFEKVWSPFAGTITARNYDIGALLAPAASGGARELFQIARTDTLRVFVNVPQEYAATVQTGQTADLLVQNYPGTRFAGHVVRSTGVVNPTTRTLRFEVDVPNPGNRLFAGMYGQVRFRVTQAEPPLLIPSSALIYNADGLSVAVVNDGKVHFQKVAVARDFGNELEVSEGLTSHETIVSNPGERLAEGLAVKTAPAGSRQESAVTKSEAEQRQHTPLEASR